MMDTDNFTHDLVADRLHRLYRSASMAGWTLITQDMFHAFAGPFPGHFHKTELREAIDAGFHAVLTQRLLQRVQHATAVIFIVHIDKVDDDNAAQITQAKLTRDGLRRFDVSVEDGVIEVAMADKRAGVDVDGGHRFGLIDDQIATRFQLNLTLQRTLDFVFNVIEVKYWLASGVMLQQTRHFRDVLGGELQ